MRLVIKIGTSTLVHSNGKPNIRHLERLCRVVADLKNAGHELVLVSSGAIAMGMGKLGLKFRPEDMPGKQAAAAVGQCELMYVYDKLFYEYNHTVAQILITGDDFEETNRRFNFRNTVFRLLESGVLPIVNENDTVSTDEISVGDNDTLAALVSKSVQADLLVLLSDIDGLYTSDPNKDSNAQLISEVTELSGGIIAAAGDSGKLGTGGMETKLKAAAICMENGIDMVIANGGNPDLLYEILENKKIGTRFIASK